MLEATAVNESPQLGDEPEKSNADRLRQYLKGDGLGHALLTAWLTGSKEGGEHRLLQALNGFQEKHAAKND